MNKLFTAILVSATSAAYIGCIDAARAAQTVKPCDLVKRHDYFTYQNAAAVASMQKDGLEKLRNLTDAVSQCRKAAELLVKHEGFDFI